jgi:hypothetical protein
MPAPFLDASKNPVIVKLIERFDPSVSFAQYEITFAEAYELVQNLIGHHQAERLPSGPIAGLDYREFKIPGSGGWVIALGYRRARVFANLLAPEYPDPQPTRPVVYTYEEFVARYSPKRRPEDSGRNELAVIARL